MRRRLAGVSGRFSGLSQPRQCGDDVLRMLVTGGPPVRGGGGMPQRIRVIGAGVRVADHRSRIIRKHAGHRRETYRLMTRNKRWIASWLVVML